MTQSPGATGDDGLFTCQIEEIAHHESSSFLLFAAEELALSEANLSGGKLDLPESQHILPYFFICVNRKQKYFV